MGKNKKPILVLVHGLRGNHKGLSHIANELTNRFEVITPDIPGSGENPELDDQNLQGHIAWLHEYIGLLPQKPYILGHSMGSIIVSHYVQKYPDDVEDKVILASPILRDDRLRKKNKALHGVMKAGLAPFPKGAKHKILASKQVSWAISHYLTADKTKQAWIDEQHYRYSGKFASAKSLMGDIHISMNYETKFPKKKEILVIFGKKDRLTNVKLVRNKTSSLGIRYREMEGAGHLINYECPEDVAAEIRSFLLF